MATINALPLVSSITGGDQLIAFITSQGDTRRLPVSALLTYFESNFISPESYYEIYYPSTGFNKTLSSTLNIWLYLHPAATLATGIVTLPVYSSAPDGQEITIFTTKEITSLTIGLNGATAVYGEPTVLGAESSFKLKYFANTSSWYRVG